MQGEGGQREQVGIGHQAVVVKNYAHGAGVVLSHIYWIVFVRAFFCSKIVIPDSKEPTLASSRAVPKALPRWVRVRHRTTVELAMHLL